VTVTTTHREGLVVGMRAPSGNPYDGHTLYEEIEQVECGAGRNLRMILRKPRFLLAWFMGCLFRVTLDQTPENAASDKAGFAEVGFVQGRLIFARPAPFASRRASADDPATLPPPPLHSAPGIPENSVRTSPATAPLPLVSVDSRPAFIRFFESHLPYLL
jgi:hypothetical protein